MGPISRYLGPEVPKEELLWQDPIPQGTALTDAEITTLKAAISNTNLSISQLATTAWASASTFRGSDMRGGANGGRIRLEPQKSWAVNNPYELNKVITVLEAIQKDFKGTVSMADLIVLGGTVAVEKGVKNAGYDIAVPFISGRGDASQEQTDVVSFGYLEPKADGFRNFIKKDLKLAAEELLIDRAQLLTLSIPEMTVIVGGMRALATNYDASKYGVFTDTVDTLTNDFFVNILDFSTTWKATSDDDTLFEGTDRKTGVIKYRGTRADLIFGSNTELRAIAEVYAADDAKERFVKDFVAAWTKVMELDLFNIKK